jgi:hypothetical protein
MKSAFERGGLPDMISRMRLTGGMPPIVRVVTCNFIMQKRNTPLLPSCHSTLNVFSTNTNVYYIFITSSILQPHAHYIFATYTVLIYQLSSTCFGVLTPSSGRFGNIYIVHLVGVLKKSTNVWWDDMWITQSPGIQCEAHLTLQYSLPEM